MKISLIVIFSVAILGINSEKVLRKCCSVTETLKKITDSENFINYVCVDNVTNAFPLFIGKGFAIELGLPKACNASDLNVTEITALSEGEDQCIDKLTAEEINGTESIVTKMLHFSCPSSSMQTTFSEIEYAIKCCPAGHSYDISNHLCIKNINPYKIEDLLLNLTNIDNLVYVIENKILQSKPEEYALELLSDYFTIELSGSSLRVSKKGEYEDMTLPYGVWCIEHEYNSGKLLARVYSDDCSKLGAICIQKCCQVGEHYVPRAANTTVSYCVRNTNNQLLNLSYYLQPLKEDQSFQEIIGLRSGLRCQHGKYLMKKTDEPHHLTSDGRLITSVSASGFTRDFCVEVFDNTTWGGRASVETLVCFEPPISSKNFTLSFVTVTISCVFLALTLFVYLWLPELRNLHGRTLICHVTVLLMASICLARVQYGYVPDVTMCTLFGYGIYFGFIAAFFWLNVMCFDIWWTFGNMRTLQPFHKKRAERRRFLWYSLYAWGLSVSFTVTVVLFDLYPVSDWLDADMGDGICWFGSVTNSKIDWPHYIFFVIPMGIISCINLALWVLTSRHCARVKAEVHRMQAGSVGDGAKKRFKMDHAKYLLTVRLWVVMGVGWVLEFLSTLASNPQWLWSTVDFINELQGVFIFIILVLKPKVFYLIRKKLGCTRSVIDPRLKPSEAHKNGALSGTTTSTFISRISQDESSNLRISIPVDKVK